MTPSGVGREPLRAVELCREARQLLRSGAESRIDVALEVADGMGTTLPSAILDDIAEDAFNADYHPDWGTCPAERAIVLLWSAELRYHGIALEQDKRTRWGIPGYEAQGYHVRVSTHEDCTVGVQLYRRFTPKHTEPMRGHDLAYLLNVAAAAAVWDFGHVMMQYGCSGDSLTDKLVMVEP